MQTTNNTVLIIGGSAGIGFEIAKLFTTTGNNKVIITGRNKQRLDNALAQLPGATGILGDISSKEDTDALVTRVQKDFPNLNILINNAGSAHLHNLATSKGAFDMASEEILTNYLAIVRLNELLIPILSAQPTAAIVNVSSVVAIVPGTLPTYSASKAALHSYTQSLRISLADAGNIKVFELMPPLVNTEFSQIIGGSKGIAPSVVAQDLIDAIEKDHYEIHVGNTAHIYELNRKSPGEAMKLMNTGK